jgi:uncharacterized protein YjbI with pentapeptide repeats
MADSTHVAILEAGHASWNDWRDSHPEISPDLSDLDVTALVGRHQPATSALNFSGVNFFGSRFEAAHLEGADFTGATLREADLSRARLSGATLTGSNLRNAYLADTQVDGAVIVNSNLNRARLVKTNLAGAQIKSCVVYGISAWQLRTTPDTKQRNLVIEDSVLIGDALADAVAGAPGYYPLMVDDLELAQFIHLVTDYKNFGKTLNALLDRGVLLLGNFRDDGKALLDRVANRLREMQRLPIIFDFERPRDTTLIETVTTLAGLSKLVIANLDGRSVPAELERIASTYEKPIVALVNSQQDSYSMFEDLLRRETVEKVPYRSVDGLIEQLPAIVQEAEAAFHRFQLRRHKDLLRKSSREPV